MSQISVKHKGPLRGAITASSDKSISHRAIMLSSLAEGKSVIRNFLHAEDPLRTLEAFRQMGIQIELKGHGAKGMENRAANDEIIVSGRGLRGLRKPERIIDCGNSGTTMRLMSGILSAQPFPSVLTGDASLRTRPMQRIITPLTEMGASITSEKNGCPPLNIRGSVLRPVRYKSPVASAQVKSAVLLAGLYCDGITTVSEPGKSRDHTERMLRACGVDVRIKDLEVSVKGVAALRPFEITVPGDFSSAAFFMVAGLIVPGSEFLIKNTGVNPTRTGLFDILKLMGGDIILENEREVSGEPVADIRVKYSRLKGIDIDSDMVLKAIDEFPVLCVAAATAEGTTRITGAGELRVKESDRIAAMAAELGKMDAAVEELEDGLIIEGREQLNPAAVQSYGDHRIAMSMIIAGLAAGCGTTVTDTDCVNTSFPEFMEILEGLQS